MKQYTVSHNHEKPHPCVRMPTLPSGFALHNWPACSFLNMIYCCSTKTSLVWALEEAENKSLEAMDLKSHTSMLIYLVTSALGSVSGTQINYFILSNRVYTHYCQEVFTKFIQIKCKAMHTVYWCQMYPFSSEVPSSFKGFQTVTAPTTISGFKVQHLERCVPTTVCSWWIVEVLFRITRPTCAGLKSYVTRQPWHMTQWPAYTSECLVRCI